MTDLRKCPFCGGEGLYMDSMTSDETEYHFVVCRDCWAEGPMCAVSGCSRTDPEELARQAWNGELRGLACSGKGAAS